MQASCEFQSSVKKLFKCIPNKILNTLKKYSKHIIKYFLKSTFLINLEFEINV